MSGIIGIKAINGLLDLAYKYLHFKIGRISFQDNRVHIGPKIEMRVVTLGLDEAGKTSILFKLKQNEFIQTIPTIGMFLGKQLQLIPDYRYVQNTILFDKIYQRLVADHDFLRLFHFPPPLKLLAKI